MLPLGRNNLILAVLTSPLNRMKEVSKTYKIITSVNDGHRLSGAFQILVRDALGQRLSAMITHNVSAEGMKEVFVAFSYAQIFSVTMTNYASFRRNIGMDRGIRCRC